MRLPRLKLPETALYHCTSRVVDQDHRFGDLEKQHFLLLLREYEAFCGVQILGYCLMSNHIHVLVEVPARPGILPSAEQLIQRLQQLTATGPSAKTVQQRLNQFRALGDRAGEQAYLETFFRRMWDVSHFMKLVKQRFSCWYNRRMDRHGTLWEERFGSTLVEPGAALANAAPYLDLNPIRAAMVEDPHEYRWSGYAAAMAGEPLERASIQRVMRQVTGIEQDPVASLEAYRCLLYLRGEEREGTDDAGRPRRKGFKREVVLDVIRHQGAVSAAEFLRCRVAHFTSGLALGSREYVEGIFQRFRSHFGRRRTNGAREIVGLAGPALFSLRKFCQGAVS